MSYETDKEGNNIPTPAEAQEQAACLRSRAAAGSEWRGSKPWDHTIPQSIDDVVSLLERRIEVHQLWLDWFESEPEASKASSEAGVGTAASQRVYIAQYKAAISLIQNNESRNDYEK